MLKSDWIKDAKDRRDKRFQDHFPIDAPLPQKFQHDIEPFIDCGHILSCVPSAFTTINSWFHKKELSWRYLYANIEHLRGGTRFRDNASYLRHFGQVADKEMPQEEYHRAKNQYWELEQITDGMKENALKYRIDKYYYVRRKDLKQAVLLSPVIVGLKTDRYWHDYRQTIIRYHWWLRHYKHAVVIYGWTPKYWLIIDCRGKKKRKLDIRHKILKRIFITKNEEIHN